MDSIADLLQQKANSLDLAKGDDLQIIQIELDRLFGRGIAKASSITQRGDLVITTGSSSNMTTIRYGYTQILKAISNQTERKIERIIIKQV